jgi:hypothetical protein
MAHFHHHSPLSRHCVSGHVLCAVTLPIAIVAAVAFPSSVPVLLRLGTITLFVAVAIAIGLAAIISTLFGAQRCALSPPTVIRIRSDGSVGGNLAAAKALGRRQWRRSGSVCAKAAAQRQRLRKGGVSAAAALARRRR